MTCRNINFAHPVNRGHTLNRGLISWHLAHKIGGFGSLAWRDLLRQNDGTLTNMDPVTDWVVTSRRGSFGSLAFDGTNDVVTISGANYAFDRTDPFTISLWLKGSDTGQEEVLFSKVAGGGAAKIGYELQISTTNVLRMYLNNNISTGNNIEVTGTTNIHDGEWHFAAMTYDGSSNASGTKIYIDGVDESSTVTDGLTATINNAVNINVCRRPGSADLHYDGSIDDLRVYNRALSAVEVFEYYVLSQHGYPRLLVRNRRLVAGGGRRRYSLTLTGVG